MESTGSSIVVVFGRPGAGKTTVADAAIQSVEKESDLVVEGLDLDVCVPQWMRDNFAKGIYPTLDQRNEFAVECCKYVRERLEDKNCKEGRSPIMVISFSFVNTDLRDIFRTNFPNATWVLIDTSEEEAIRRINNREDHFYKGNTPAKENEADDKKESKIDDGRDNSEWEFAEVTFDHKILKGKDSVETNARALIEILKLLSRVSP